MEILRQAQQGGAAPPPASPGDAPDATAQLPARPSGMSIIKRYQDQQEAQRQADNPDFGPGIDPQSDSAHAAGLSTIAGASFIEDPQAQAKYYAHARGLPLDRYRVAGNTVIYKADDGKWYREEPNPNPSDLMSVVKHIAGLAGPSVPFAAGGATGIATAPMLAAGPLGMVGSIGLTAGAAGAGEAVKQAVGSYLSGSDQMAAGPIASEAGTAALGQGIGGVGVGIANRTAARDIGKLDPAAVAGLQAKAATAGIQLTPAEITNLRSLKMQQTNLNNLPRSADRMDEFYRARAEQQVAPAIEGHIASLSPQDSPLLAGQGATRAAQGVVKGAEADRGAAASPLYQKAFASGATADPSPQIAYIDSALTKATGARASYLNKVRGFLTDPTGAPKTDLESLHNAKLEIDNLIEGAHAKEGSAAAVIERDLTTVKTGLTAKMKAASPDYELGNAVFNVKTLGLTDLKQSLVGSLSRLQSGSELKAASTLLDQNAGAEAAGKAAAILSAKAPDALQDLKRAYLQQAWTKAQKEFASNAETASNAGNKWRAALLGDKTQANVLRAVLSPSEWTALNDLGDVLQATGRVLQRGSHTAMMGEALGDMKAEARGLVGGAVVGATKAVSATPLKGASDFLERKMMGAYTERLADIVTSPDAMAQLKQLKRLSPNKARLIAGFTDLVTQGASYGAGQLLDAPATPQPVQP